MWTKIPEFDKLNFLASFTTLRAKTFKTLTIFSAFRKIGLISYNLQIVLQKVCLANSQLSSSQPVAPPLLVNFFCDICIKHLDGKSK